MTILDAVIKILTLVSIIIGICAFFRGITTYNKQMNAQVFFQYAKRYDEIMNSFPRSAKIARIKSSEALPKPSAELTICVLRYFNLCSEEFYLHEAKYMSKRSGMFGQMKCFEPGVPLYSRGNGKR